MTICEKTTLMILLSSLSMLVLERTLLEIISPLTAEWDWARLVENKTVVTNSTLSAKQSPLTAEWVWARLVENKTVVTNSTQYANQSLPAETLNWNLSLVFVICPIVELIFSPFLGVVSEKTGIDFIAFVGVILAIVICIIYAFTDTFLGILIARILQGVDIVCLSPAAMVRIEGTCPSDTKEGKSVIGLALSTSAISFAFISISSTIYEYLGQMLSFLLMVPMELMTAVTILMTCQFKMEFRKDKKEENAEIEISPKVSFAFVVKDTSILVATGLVAVVWVFLPILDPIVASWLENTFSSGPSEVSLLWGTASLPVVLANVISACFTMVKPQLTWLYSFFHLIFSAIPVILLPMTPSFWWTCAAFMSYIYFACCVRFGAVFLISNMAETKYAGAHNHVWAIANYGFALPFLVGNAVGAPLYNSIGFTKLCLAIGMIMLLYSLLIICLRNAFQQAENAEAIPLMQIENK